MKAYIVASTGGGYFVEVSKIYKTYNGAKKAKERYCEGKNDNLKILVADNWQEAEETSK